MCGRFATFTPVSLSLEAGELLRALDLDILGHIRRRGDQFNIGPTNEALAVAHGDHAYEAKPLRWGLVPSWAKDDGAESRLTNARIEAIATKSCFRTALIKRRCLIPACGYFEWTGLPRHKQRHFIHDPAGCLMMFAGVWEGRHPWEWDELLRTFTLVTGSRGLISRDIRDRTPIVLPPDLWMAWLDGTADDALAALRAAPPSDLVASPADKGMKSLRNSLGREAAG